MIFTSCPSLFVAAAILLVASPTPGEAKVAGAWREVFQSSPVDYAPVQPEAEKALRERFNIPPEALEQWRPKPPVTGTVRFPFAVSAGGTQLRIRISNETSQTPLRLAGASIGLAADGFGALPGSLKPLTFGGKSTITIPPGAPVLSDPVDLTSTAGTKLVASVHLADPYQFEPRGGSLIAVADGDQTLSESLQGMKTMTGRPLITGAEVYATPAPGVIVALGDSITDGNRENLNELRAWPEQLARRLAARRNGRPLAVVNAGIGGNTLLYFGWGQSALARLDRDVFRIQGVTHLIVLEGTNDISGAFGTQPSAEDLIAAYRQIIARAHARGIKVVLGTITPAGGSVMHSSPEKDLIREAVNDWIRTSNEADAVIDFHQITRDPADPGKLLKAYDIGDYLHPSEAGHKAMGDGIDLSIFD